MCLEIDSMSSKARGNWLNQLESGVEVAEGVHLVEHRSHVWIRRYHTAVNSEALCDIIGLLARITFDDHGIAILAAEAAPKELVVATTEKVSPEGFQEWGWQDVLLQSGQERVLSDSVQVDAPTSPGPSGRTDESMKSEEPKEDESALAMCKRRRHASTLTQIFPPDSYLSDIAANKGQTFTLMPNLAWLRRFLRRTRRSGLPKVINISGMYNWSSSPPWSFFQIAGLQEPRDIEKRVTFMSCLIWKANCTPAKQFRGLQSHPTPLLPRSRRTTVPPRTASNDAEHPILVSTTTQRPYPQRTPGAPACGPSHKQSDRYLQAPGLSDEDWEIIQSGIKAANMAAFSQTRARRSSTRHRLYCCTVHLTSRFRLRNAAVHLRISPRLSGHQTALHRNGCPPPSISRPNITSPLRPTTIPPHLLSFASSDAGLQPVPYTAAPPAATPSLASNDAGDSAPSERPSATKCADTTYDLADVQPLELECTISTRTSPLGPGIYYHPPPLRHVAAAMALVGWLKEPSAGIMAEFHPIRLSTEGLAAFADLTPVPPTPVTAAVHNRRKVERRIVRRVVDESEEEYDESEPESDVPKKKSKAKPKVKKPVKKAAASSAATSEAETDDMDVDEPKPAAKKAATKKRKAEDGAEPPAKKAKRADNYPWKLESVAVKRDWNQMKAPPFEMFHWARVVVDTYLDGKIHALITNLTSERHWVLSGTPPIHDFAAVKTIAAFLDIHLGVDGDGEGRSAEVKKRRREQTAVERFHSFREVHTLEWHAHRHTVGQAFLDQFVRQNIAEIDEIPWSQHKEDIALPAAERAIYLELEHHLRALEMTIKRGKKAESDMEKLLNQSLGDSNRLILNGSADLAGDESKSTEPPDARRRAQHNDLRANPRLTTNRCVKRDLATTDKGYTAIDDLGSTMAMWRAIACETRWENPWWVKVAAAGLGWSVAAREKV
ncbi:hypothetical protein DFP72DRAFT_850494 [Ephemerocybe angulata]|uniref:Uncharacterized protein n=1 Tax=Ephemerocybe angulata TaxID=980116 RepID=A0A8H6HR47_9AGAR|nr:hypothetical protein DFP72DRAFT_850494 [Tulosesus angulatus]